MVTKVRARVLQTLVQEEMLRIEEMTVSDARQRAIRYSDDKSMTVDGYGDVLRSLAQLAQDNLMPAGTVT